MEAERTRNQDFRRDLWHWVMGNIYLYLCISVSISISSIYIDISIYLYLCHLYLYLYHLHLYLSIPVYLYIPLSAYCCVMSNFKTPQGWFMSVSCLWSPTFSSPHLSPYPSLFLLVSVHRKYLFVSSYCFLYPRNYCSLRGAAQLLVCKRVVISEH